MDFVALDGTKLLALMAAGGIFSLAGLWLMFRPSSGGEAAKIEFFGLKFQSSSAGLLVFLIGAVFLAVPIFVPERSSTDVNAARAEAGAVSSEQISRPTTGSAAIVLPPKANATEQEPNNDVTEANQIELGSFYSGRTDPERKDLQDWFVVPAGMSDLTLQLRNTGWSDYCRLTILNEDEEQIERFVFPAKRSATNETFFAGGAKHIFMRVDSPEDGVPCTYEFKVH